MAHDEGELRMDPLDLREGRPPGLEGHRPDPGVGAGQRGVATSEEDGPVEARRAQVDGAAVRQRLRPRGEQRLDLLSRRHSATLKMYYALE